MAFHKMLEIILWDCFPCCHAITADFTYVLSYCESLVLPHPQAVVVDSDSVNEKTTKEHCNPCAAHATSLRSFVLCDSALQCRKVKL